VNLESIQISKSNESKAAQERAVIVSQTRWNHLLREYVHTGAPNARAVESLLNTVVAELAFGLRDWGTRTRAAKNPKPWPRIAMTRAKHSRERTVIIALNNRQKAIPVNAFERHVEVENEVIDVSSFGGVMSLVEALTREIQHFWNDHK
jgi:hypothetical protein